MKKSLKMKLFNQGSHDPPAFPRVDPAKEKACRDTKLEDTLQGTSPDSRGNEDGFRVC